MVQALSCGIDRFSCVENIAIVRCIVGIDQAKGYYYNYTQYGVIIPSLLQMTFQSRIVTYWLVSEKLVTQSLTQLCLCVSHNNDLLSRVAKVVTTLHIIYCPSYCTGTEGSWTVADSSISSKKCCFSTVSAD